MGRVVGIDYGNKRVGVAVTDPAQIFAFPLNTFKASEIDKFIADYVASENVEAFVVGYPVQLNNEPSESVRYVNPFIKKLRKTYPGLPVYLVDERFTSQMALQTMIDGGMKKKGRQNKMIIDMISASIILQSWIDGKASKK
jgi:putative Holliday junction resolvase